MQWMGNVKALRVYLWKLSNADLRCDRTLDALHCHRNVAISNQRQQENIAFQIVLSVDSQTWNVQIEGQDLLVQIKSNHKNKYFH